MLSSESVTSSSEQRERSTWSSALLSIILLMSISSFKSVLSLIIFSDSIASPSPTRNYQPLICWYWSNCLSDGSLWNLDVMMKSYPSASQSSLSEAWHFNVLMNAEVVRKVSQLGIFFSYQFWIKPAIARKNDGLLSPITAAFPG